MSTAIFASLRESFPSSEFTIAATSGGSTTVATNLYYWVNGYSRGGMNLLTSLGRVAVNVGQKLVFTVTAIAPGDDVFGFILSASETNDATTAKILAIADARDINQETVFTPPLVTELTHDAHFGLGVTGALPTSNKLNGQIRYASGNYQQYVAQSDSWQIVNGWNAYIATTQTTLSTGVYKNGCDIPILSNNSIIDLPDYTGGTSTRFRLSLLNGLTESSGNILPVGSKIILNVLLDNNGEIAADYLNNLIQITPIHVIRRADGTVTTLSESTRTWEWGKPFYTLTSNLQRGYAIAFDVAVVNAVLPQGATLVFYLSDYGRISERIPSTGSGSLVHTDGDKCRLYPMQLGVLRGTGSGVIETTGETYAYPFSVSTRESFSFGLLSDTADQVAAISGISNGEIIFRANTGQVLATEAVRAIASTEAVTVTPSAWVSVGSVTANQLINVTIDYPCDANGIGTIRSDYPDVIAGSAIGEFNPDKLRVFLRKNGTTITETTAIAVTPGTSQGFTIDNIGTSATLPTATASNIGFWDYGAIATTTSGNSSNLTAGTYEICVAYQYEGDKIVSLSHATADGCIPELTVSVATATELAGYFSEVYQSGTLKPQVTGLNFANNWFTVTQNSDRLDVDLTGVSRLWPVVTPPNANFDYADGVRSGDSARLTVSPFTIYDCLDATTGAAVWQTRGSGSGGGSGGYTTLTQSFTIPAIAASQTVTVADASFLIDGLYVALPGGHFLLVNGTPSGLTVNLKNEGFATATTVINNGAVLTVTGKPGTNGTNGNNGSAATIAVGTVTTGSAGSNVIVTNSGSSSAAVFDITIPRGDTGLNGTNGGIISTVSVTTTFTIPSLSNTQTQNFSDASWVSVGATVFFSDGTNYANLEVTAKATNTLTLKNTWGQTNGTTIAIAGVLSPSGKPGTNGSNGANGTNGTNGVNADMTRTSTNSVAIGTGSKTFTYSASSNLGWFVGGRLRAAYDGSNYVEGPATAVSTNSVTINVDNAVGSGTYTSWVIGIAGDKGASGGTFADNVFRIQDNTDPTKQIAFEASGITTGTTQTITVPNASGTMALIDTTGLSDKDLFYYDSASKLFKRIAIGTTNQALIAKPSLDPPFQFGTIANSGGRELLTSDRTYYVRTDGSDSNNGLTNTSGGAFATWQKAIDTYAAIDQSIYNVTIQGNTGTHTLSATLVIKKAVGSGKLIIQGSTSTASDCILSGTIGSNFLGSDGGYYFVSAILVSNIEIKNLQFNCNQNGNWSTTLLTTSANLTLSNLTFNQTGFNGNGYTLYCTFNSIVSASGLVFQGNVYFSLVIDKSIFSYVDGGTISHSATSAFAPLYGDGARLRFFNITWTASGTAWSYLLKNYTHIVMKSGKTISGTKTDTVEQIG